MRHLGPLFLVFLCLFSLCYSQFAWESCSIYTDGTASDRSAECTQFSTVRNYNTSTGSINIFMKRLVGQRAGNNQLYLIADGPGISGTMYEGVLEKFVTALNEQYTVYIMDHRGTGRSDYIQCPETTSNTIISGNCTSYISSLLTVDEVQSFSTYSIARDYLTFIGQQRSSPSDNVLLFGTGYGGYIINQMLLIDNTTANAVVIDSFMYPTETDYDYYADVVGNDFIGHCDNFGTCAREFQNGSPEEVFKQLFTGFEGLRCPKELLITRSNLQTIFRNIASNRANNALLLPIAVRMVRCNTDDLTYLRAGISQFLPVFADYYSNTFNDSYVVRNQITLREFLPVEKGERQPSVDQLNVQSFNEYFSNFQPSYYTSIGQTWTFLDGPLTYDAFTLAKTSVPLLVLGAEFDMFTAPYYSALLYNSLKGELQRFVELPFASHATLFNSPTKQGENCGFTFATTFFNQGPGAWNPRQLGNLCIRDLEPIDFSGNATATKQRSQQLFGDNSVWGSGPIPYNANGAISSVVSSNYVFLPYSTNNLPDVPKLNLSLIVVFDTYDSSQRPENADRTLSDVHPGQLPSSRFFTPDGMFNAGSHISPSLCGVIAAILLFATYLF